MNRVIAGLGFFASFLMFCVPVQAGIQWASGIVSSEFMIVSQGGSFYYPLAFPFVDTWSNSNLNVLNEDSLTEFDTSPHQYPGTATLVAKSAGGSLSRGSQVQLYSGISFTGEAGTPDHFDANENGMNVSQLVTANIKRQFTNNESTPINIGLRANLGGTINFNTINYSYDLYFDQNPETAPILDETHYAYYLLNGQVAIIEYNPDESVNTTYSIPVNNNNLGGIIEDIVLQPANEGYYYELVCSLYLETHVKNYHASALGFQSYAIDGPFRVGDALDPLSGVRLRAYLVSGNSGNSLPWLPLLLLD